MSPQQARPFLDPQGPKPTPAGVLDLREPIPPEIRSFGYLPDVRQCKPGDLILFSAVEPALFSKAIIGAQADGGYSEFDAAWHHVAVFVGGYEICEAQNGKVRISPIFDYVGSHRILVRRDVSLDDETRSRIMADAIKQLQKPYGWLAALRLGIQSRFGFWQRNEVRASQHAAICSQLYADAYTRVTNKLLILGKLGTPMPAGLSLTAALKDVSVDWLKIS
jgi:cell wall-associated NlpC family hydrolase